MRWGVLGGLLFAAAAGCWGQTDSLELARAEQDRRIHRTTVAAAVLPGAGQLLNRKFWKAPIVWAGVWWTASSIQFNAAEFRTFRDALVAETDGDAGTVNATGFTAAELNDRALFYRRQRDVSFLALLAVHGLSVLDANVDAHLMDFDVSENLKAGLHVEPMPDGRAIWGVGLRWDLAKIPHSRSASRTTW